ncbi:MAG: TrkA C-terminal domain-containing protein, partial [Actinomycetota bacterium]
SMCRVIETDGHPHPIIAAALASADEIVAEASVAAGSRTDGATLADLRLHTGTGMEVLAVQRSRRWVYRPRRSYVLRSGDRLLAIGPEEGAPRLREWCGDARPEGEEGWLVPKDSDQ